MPGRYLGCSLSSKGGRLRLRYRWGQTQKAVALGVRDTPDARATWQPLVAVVGRLVRAGRDPEPVLRAAVAERRESGAVPAAPTAAGPMLETFAQRWIAQREVLLRRAEVKKLRHNVGRYIAPRLGGLRIANLAPADVRGFQLELLTVGPPLAPRPRVGRPSPQQPLNVKTVRNIVKTLRAILKAARREGLVSADQFTRLFDLEWPAADFPDPDPFTDEELARIQAWFDRATYRVSWDGRIPWPAFAVFVYLLAWSGMRPSEAAGLHWGDVDLEAARLVIRRSRHLRAYALPKTRAARRTVELAPETVRRLRALMPLRVTPEMPVFTNTNGLEIEPTVFLGHFHAAQRALGIRVRGLYSLKDTFVSRVIRTPAIPIAWLEQQTGVAYATLRKHYAKWWPSAMAASPFAALVPSIVPRQRARGGTRRACAESAEGIRQGEWGSTPPAAPPTAEDFSGSARQEPAPGGPECAPGARSRRRP